MTSGERIIMGCQEYNSLDMLEGGMNDALSLLREQLLRSFGDNGQVILETVELNIKQLLFGARDFEVHLIALYEQMRKMAICALFPISNPDTALTFGNTMILLANNKLKTIVYSIDGMEDIQAKTGQIVDALFKVFVCATMDQADMKSEEDLQHASQMAQYFIAYFGG